MSKSTKVTLSQMALTFSLPDDFGSGWDYENITLYGPGHAWAGSYNRQENANFAHEALHRIQGIDQTSLYVGTSCTARFVVEKIEEASEIQSRLQALVDAFPRRENREITVRGSHFYDAEVTEYDRVADEEVIRMPFLAYLAKHVPLAAETHPALKGEDIATLLTELETFKQSFQSVSQPEETKQPHSNPARMRM